MDELRLDGNAVGGLLGEIFPFEMTTAQEPAPTAARSGGWDRRWSMDTAWARSYAVLRATTPSSVSVAGRDDTC
jgi:hypothetical protein